VLKDTTRILLARDALLPTPPARCALLAAVIPHPLTEIQVSKGAAGRQCPAQPLRPTVSDLVAW